MPKKKGKHPAEAKVVRRPLIMVIEPVNEDLHKQQVFVFPSEQKRNEAYADMIKKFGGSNLTIITGWETNGKQVWDAESAGIKCPCCATGEHKAAQE